MTAPRLKEKYTNEIVAKLEKDLALDNVNKVPRLEKIVVNMGVGAAAADHKLLDAAMGDLRIITGQAALRDARQEVHRRFPRARRPAHRLQGHAARRPHVRNCDFQPDS